MKDSTEKIKIIIADDYPRYIQGLKHILSTSSIYKILDECENGLELTKSPELPFVNVLLVDIDMPVMNGIEAAKKINWDYPQLPMIAITMHQDTLYLNDIIGAGFKAFIYKPEAADNLLNVIEQVINKKFVFPDNLLTN